MKARDLIISVGENLKGAKEFNHLRVVNLDNFLSTYEGNLDYYQSPFKILADLEDKIKFENNPDQTVMCSYKAGGEVIFDLVDIKEQGNLRVVNYKFSTFIS